MRIIYDKYRNLSKQTRDSIVIAATLVGGISTMLSILGISLGTFGISNILFGFGTVVIIFILLFLFIYIIIGKIFKESLNIQVRKTSISIACGNIFSTSGIKVIGCDTHFSTLGPVHAI